MFYLNRLAFSALTATLMALSITDSTQAQSISSPANQPTARAIRGAAAVVPLASEPPPKLVVDDPLAEPLTLGRVVVQYRTENLHIVPVYGPAALDISPRAGHLHVTVDDASWHWLDASNEPITLNGLSAGRHRLLVELADPTHKIIDAKTITFIVPERK